jgi:prenyltransferase beta subunit
MLSDTHYSTHVEKYYVEGDELPGIGGSDDVPDTCYAWWDQKDQMMHIANATWMIPRDHGKPIK